MADRDCIPGELISLTSRSLFSLHTQMHNQQTLTGKTITLEVESVRFMKEREQ